MEKKDIKTITYFFLIGLLFLGSLFLFKNSFDNFYVQNQTSQLGAVEEAAEGYVPITPGFEAITGDVGAGEGFTSLLGELFNWGIGLTVVLATVFVVLGAVQYMTTDALYDKKEGRQRIASAVGGLILALISWLILWTINPNIIENNFLNSLQNLGDGSGSLENPGP